MSSADTVIELPLTEPASAETFSDTNPHGGEVCSALVKDVSGILRTVVYRATDSTASFVNKVSRAVGIPWCMLRVWPPNSANYLLGRQDGLLRDEVRDFEGVFEAEWIAPEPVQVTLDGARELAIAVRGAFAPGASPESVIRQTALAARIADDLLVCLDDLRWGQP